MTTTGENWVTLDTRAYSRTARRWLLASCRVVDTRRYRGRVMGARMLAVYGMPLGLLAGGALIEWMGIRFQMVAFGTAGLVLFGVAVAATRGRWLGAAATRAASTAA